MMPSKILIVEDDAAIRTLARSILEEEGHEIIEADSLAVQPAARPDLILFDVGFGFEALVQVVAGGAPVLVLTAWAAPELLAAAEDLGARGHVQKPFDCGELRERVAAALPTRTSIAAAA
jgi:DNA-binding response OmpR family regulator